MLRSTLGRRETVNDESSQPSAPAPTYRAMRHLIFIAVLIVMPTAAFAACIPVAPTENRAENLANEQALTLCRAQELHDATAFKAQQLQFQADLQAQAANFQQDLRMQQTFAAAATPPQF